MPSLLLCYHLIILCHIGFVEVICAQYCISTDITFIIIITTNITISICMFVISIYSVQQHIGWKLFEFEKNINKY